MHAVFNISTYVEDCPDPEQLKRRPPRTAKLVVALCWSWSPAHHRSAVYWLCSNKHRTDWILWEQSGDWETGKPRFQEVAIGGPRKRACTKDAAMHLLTAAWKAEWQAWESPGSGAFVEQAGILDAGDIKRIEAESFREPG